MERKHNVEHVRRGNSRIDNESLLGRFIDEKIGVVIVMNWNDNNLHSS